MSEINTEVGYGYFDTIPMSQVVARTKVRLQLRDSSDYDGEIELFCNEALASLGTKYNFIKKNCKVEIINGRVKMPRGMSKLLGMRTVVDPSLNTADTNTANFFNTTTAFWNQFLYLEQTFLTNCQNEPSTLPSLIPYQAFLPTMEIIGGYMMLPLPCPFTHAIISYMGYATTDDCVLEVKAAYERGLSEYAYGMMLQTYPQLWLPEWGNRENAIDRAMMTWVGQRGKIVSDGFADDWNLNKYQVKRVLNALLQDQNYFSQTS